MLTTVAVAWGCGLSVSIYGLAFRATQTTIVTPDGQGAEGGRSAEVSYVSRGSSAGASVVLLDSESGNLPALKQAIDSVDELRPWRQVLNDQLSNGMVGVDARVYLQGFPCHGFQGIDLPDAWPEPLTFGLIRTGDIGEHVICYQPRWLGLAADTLFWGALWLGVLAVPAAMRGSRRRRKGLCPACRYDLLGDLDEGCPECGWNREDVRPRVLTASPASPGTP